MAALRPIFMRSLTIAAVLAAGLLVHAPTIAAQSSPSGESVELVNGCTNVSLTWPPATAIANVAAAINPAGSVQAVWKLDAQSQRFLAWSPGAPQASDLTSVNPLDAVFICTSSAATMMRPLLSSSPSPATSVSGFVPAPPPTPTVSILSFSDRMWRGGTAHVTVAAPLGTWCDIQYTPPPGTPASTTALGPKRADQTGQVSWQWTVVPLTPPGLAYVAILCNGMVLSATIIIV
jgi:hypothetical protein